MDVSSKGQKSAFGVPEDFLKEKFEREQFQYAVTEAIQEGLITYDPFGLPTSYNSAASRILELDGSEILERRIDDSRWKFVRADGSEVPPEDFLTVKVMRTGRAIQRIKIGIQGPKEIKWLVANSVPVENSAGRWIVLTFSNYTDDEQINSITSDSSELIDQIVSGIGHEISNPLSIISGQLSIIEDLLTSSGPIGQEVAERFGRIDENIKRIAQVLKNLRSFSKETKHEHGAICILEVIEDLQKNLQPSLKKQGINLVLNGKPMNTFIYGNRDRIHKAIYNLLSNAIDATYGRPDKKIDIEISNHEHDLKISVSDNGKGIPQNIQKRIFNPFFTTKEVGKSLGLGLPLTLAIIEEHKGKIDYITKLDAGSTFNIYLPLSPEDEKCQK